MSGADLTIRLAEPADVAEILRLIRALAAYEKVPEAVLATEDTLMETLFGECPVVFAHLATIGGRAIGLALWFHNYSTWTGRPGIYLEDMFVEEDARRQGVAHALFEALAAEAKARGCARIDWAVLDWNIDAMRFYASLGAKRATGWEPWRLEGNALEALAGG